MIHRWTREADIVAMLWLLRQMIDRAGSVEGFFLEGYDPKAEDIAGAPSDDGHVYTGGFTMRMRPDGTGLEWIAGGGFDPRGMISHRVRLEDINDTIACMRSGEVIHALIHFPAAQS